MNSDHFSSLSKRQKRRICSNIAEGNLKKLDYDYDASELPLPSTSDKNVSQPKELITSEVNVSGIEHLNSSNEFQDYPIQDPGLSGSYSFHTFCSEDELSDETEEFPLQEKLECWAVSHSITLTAITSLLKILRPHHPHLPADARTLLKTPRNTVVKTLNNGHYSHFGIERNLKHSTQISKLPITSPAIMNVNVDGLQIHESSTKNFWPILGKLESSEPFVIGLFLGTGKPIPIERYLEDFIAESSHLLENGFEIDGVNFQFQFGAFICDAPARAYLKCVKLHNAYHACEKCSERGEWDGRVVFVENDSTLRTDSSFQQKVDEDHHVGVSPLEKLYIGMVSQFPFDYMHMVCLGVTRRLLLTWIKGPLVTRLGSTTINNISSDIESLGQYTPREFSRQHRSLAKIHKWKATEFRSFLLYAGPIVLKNKIKNEMYDNFMLLNCAITILDNPMLCKGLGEYAGTLLHNFVKHCGALYGNSFVVYNVHCLLHLHLGVKKFGPLCSFSAFPYETHLGKIKRLVHCSTLPLQQVHRRLTEKQNSEKKNVCNKVNDTTFSLVHLHKSGPAPFSGIQYKTLNLNDVQYNINGTGNNCCQLINDDFVLIRNFISNETGNFIVGHVFSDVVDYYAYVCKSSRLQIFHISNMQENLNFWNISEIKKKFIIYPFEENFVVFPL